MANIEEKVEMLLEPVVNGLGYVLYDVFYVKEGKDYFLRIFIDSKEKSIDLDDCEKVSNAINDLLDREDLIKEMYFLEVSSPGVERVLRKDWHLEEEIGEKIEVCLFKPVDGIKKYDGTLKSWNDSYIEIENENGSFKFERKSIALIRKKYNW